MTFQFQGFDNVVVTNTMIDVIGELYFQFGES
jgi:hypothetical protein